MPCWPARPASTRSSSRTMAAASATRAARRSTPSRRSSRAVGGGMPVLIDSGFRRGTDIVKALALGARAVCVGRPYLWGLGAFGQPGVERVLDILRGETRAAMQQLGAPSLEHLTPSMVARA